MIYLKLFLTFLKIGAVSFGGGYAMIPLIRETVVGNGWLTDGELLNFIAVAESTPGPIAINMATFVGSAEGGLLGSAAATLGVILPSFLIILLIAAFLHGLLKIRAVRAALDGIAPVVTALILSTALIMMLQNFFSLKNLESTFRVDVPSLIIFGVLSAVAILYKKFRKKKISPILLILLSGGLGMIFYL